MQLRMTIWMQQTLGNIELSGTRHVSIDESGSLHRLPAPTQLILLRTLLYIHRLNVLIQTPTRSHGATGQLINDFIHIALAG
jgi:hypothetical protein